MLTAWAGLLTVLVLAGAVLRPWYAREFGHDLRPSIRRALWGGFAAWALCHVSGVVVVIRGARMLEALGPRVTPRDHAFMAFRAVGESWWGMAFLALCLVAAGALILSRRGKGGRAFVLLVLAVVLPVVFLFRNISFAPGPQPSEPSGEPWVPEEARVSYPPVSSPPSELLEPLVDPLMILAGVVVLLGLASVLRAATRRRPWPCPPTDALLLVGTAASVCTAVLFVESAFLERASVVFTMGSKGPPVPVLIDDFLRAAAPGALVGWAGLTVIALGMLDRVRGRRVDGGAVS